MTSNDHHKSLIDSFATLCKPLLDHSDQAVYIYLDDHNKVCNKKFASLLGYATPEEWASVKTSFPQTFVEKKSQSVLVSAFQQAMEKIIASTIDVTWKKKSGESVPTSVILTPIVFENHFFALHFITSKSKQ